MVRGRLLSTRRLAFMALIVGGAVGSVALAGAEVTPGGGGPYGYGPMGGGATQGGLGSIKPLSGHELLLVLVQFGLLLLVARILGEARGQPRRR